MNEAKINQRVEEEDEIDLLALASTLLRNAWKIILVACVTGAISLGSTMYFVAPSYQANVELYVNNSSFTLGQTSFSISSAQISAAQSLVDTYIVILKSRSTLERVIEYSGLDYTVEQLSEMISAGAVNSTEVFNVVVTSHSPTDSAVLANAVSKVLPDRVAEIVDGSDMRIVDTAIVPSKKSAPSYSKSLILGVLIGGFLMCAYYVICDLIDVIIHSGEFLEKNFEYPVLASISNTTKEKKERGKK